MARNSNKPTTGEKNSYDDLIGPWSRAWIPLSNGLMDGTHPSVHSDYKALTAIGRSIPFSVKKTAK